MAAHTGATGFLPRPQASRCNTCNHPWASKWIEDGLEATRAVKDASRPGSKLIYSYLAEERTRRKDTAPLPSLDSVSRHLNRDSVIYRQWVLDEQG